MPPPVPADDAIRRILAHHADEPRLGPGLVAGITEAARHRIDCDRDVIRRLASGCGYTEGHEVERQAFPA